MSHPRLVLLALSLAAILLGVNLQHAARAWLPLIARVLVSQPASGAKGVVLLVGDDAADHAWRDALTALAYVVVSIDRASFARCRDEDGCTALARDAAAQAAIVALPPIVVARGDEAEQLVAQAVARPATHALVSIDHCPSADALARFDALDEAPPWYVFLPAGARCATLAGQATHANLHLSRTAAAGGAPPPAEFGALLQWLDPRHAGQGRSDASLAGIPLVLHAVAHARRAVLFMSGDGGWAELDRGVARVLVGEGIAVIGWDALAYFWQPRTPDALARDLARVLTEFQARWHLEQVVIAGYSFCASALPFAINRLPPANRALIEKVVLFGPTPTTSFEFHLAQWLGSAAHDDAEVGPEIERLAPLPTWCVHGETDSEAACPALAPPGRSLVLPGDHHFNGDYPRLARLLAELPDARRR